MVNKQTNKKLKLALMMIFMVVIALLQLTIGSEAQSCLLASNGDRPLPNFIRTNDKTLHFEDSPIQAIITSYRFNCCGVITEWRAIVERSNLAHQNGAYSISFQVWRPNSPSPVDTDGCYTLIGVNHFPNIQLPSVDSGSPMRGLVIGTLPESEQIEVQPGDVVGFYLTNIEREDNGIQFADPDDNVSPYQDETVWYGTVSATSGGGASCQFPVGTSGVLSFSTNLAPLITASISRIGCLQPTTTLAVLTTSTQMTTQPNPSTEPSPLNSESSQVDFLTVNTFLPSISPTSQVNSNTLLPSSLTDLPTSSPGSGLENTGLTIGVAAGSSVFVLFVLLVIIIMIVCILKKKRSKNSYKPTEPISYSTVKQETKEEDNADNLYDTADLDTTDPPTMNNEAYGKFTEATTTPEENLYDNIHDAPIDLRILTSQNAAYGDIPTSIMTNEDEDYYTNEGMNGPMKMNEAYGGMNQQNHTNRDDGSIPTTENEAYTSVSANTDRMETEETYDYVRNL